jgi:hypothetical protein
MHHRVLRNLEKKGWDEHYLSHTVSILKKAEKKKKLHIKILDRILYVLILIFILSCNILLLFGLMPVIVSMPLAVSLIVILILGVAFGFVADNLLMDIEMTHKHYIISALMIILFSLATMVLGIHYWKTFLVSKGIFVNPNLPAVLFFYITSFLSPHIYINIRKKNHESS